MYLMYRSSEYDCCPFTHPKWKHWREEEQNYEREIERWLLIQSGEKRIHRKYSYPAVTYVKNDGEKFFTYATNGFFRENNEFYSMIIPDDSYEFTTYHSDEPTIVWKNGTKQWKKMNVSNFHREDDLPAVIYPNGDVEYWVRGLRHRKDGPAVIYGNKQYWFVEGKFEKEENNVSV